MSLWSAAAERSADAALAGAERRGGAFAGWRAGRPPRASGAFQSGVALSLPAALQKDALPAALLPLRESATLQSIAAAPYPGEASQGARPVAEFWAEFDAQQAAGKK